MLIILAARLQAVRNVQMSDHKCALLEVENNSPEADGFSDGTEDIRSRFPSVCMDHSYTSTYRGFSLFCIP